MDSEIERGGRPGGDAANAARPRSQVGMGIVPGVAIGAAWGSAFGQLALGAGFGAAAGVVLGAALDGIRRRRA